MNNFPIQFTDKVNSPELVAIMQQFGEQTYVDAELINKYRDALNELHARTADTRIVDNTGLQIVGTDVVINELWKWLILSVLYSNDSQITLTITLSSEGNQKLCYLCANQDNGFELVYGPESETNPVAPTIPDNLLYITFFLVTDGTVGTPAEPIIGDIYKKKTESLGYGDPYLTGENAVIQLRPEGISRYAFSNPTLVSIDGFGLSLIDGNPSADVPYDGKDLFIENTGTTPFNLKHDGSGSANIKFFFIDETDLIIPAGGKIWLKYGFPYCEVIFKSWVQDLPKPNLQQVTDSGNTTTKSIHVTDPGVYTSLIGDSNISSINLENNDKIELYPNAILIKNGLGEITISPRPLENATTFYLEDEGGSKSIATREWVEILPKPNLQQVTDSGNTTENNIEINLDGYQTILGPGSISLSDIDKYSDLSRDGLAFGDVIGGNFQTTILTRERTQNTDFYFENEGGSKSIATREWVDEIKLITDLRIRRKGITIFDDMTSTASGVSPFVKNAFNNGSISINTAITAHHQGIVGIASTISGTNGGGSILMANVATARNMTITPGLQFDIIITSNSFSNNVFYRFGFISGTVNPTDVADGFYFEWNGANLVAKTASGSVRSSSVSYIMTSGTWYHLRIKMITESLINFEVYNDNGDLLFNTSLSTNIPPVGTGTQPGFIGFNQIAENKTMCVIDYISATYPTMNRGALT